MASPDGEFVYVADRLDDTISVVATATGQRPSTISLGPRPEPDAADRGERLYTECQALARRLDELSELPHRRPHQWPLSDTLGDGSYGAPRESHRSWESQPPVPGHGQAP